jgi:membrane protein
MKAQIKRTASLLKCAASYWNSDNASNTGAALAFYCAFSIAPLLVILLTLAGLFVNANAADAQVRVQLTSLFGPATAKVLLGAVHSAQHTEGIIATLVSVVTLAVGSTTVLAALQAALEVIWASQRLAIAGIRGWIRTRLLSFGFILTLGFLLLISLTLSAAVANLRAQVAARYPALVTAIAIVDFAVSLLVVAGLFALIYRYMPARRLPWRTVLAGGLLTAVLFDAGRWVVGLYLAHSTQPSAYGAASSFAALLLWLYYTSQIFLFGAEFTSCLAGLRSAAIGDAALEPREEDEPARVEERRPQEHIPG